MTRKQFAQFRAEVDRLRSYRSADDISEIETRNGEMTFDVRYLGDWEIPSDVDDDDDCEDYDWKVPTAATRARLNDLCKRHPGVQWFNQGEKCWISFSAKETK